MNQINHNLIQIQNMLQMIIDNNIMNNDDVNHILNNFNNVQNQLNIIQNNNQNNIITLMINNQNQIMNMLNDNHHRIR